MTGPEAAAFNALKSAFQGALPNTPANYALAIRFGTDAGEIMLPEAIKPDQMALMRFTATYTLSRDFQDGQQRASFMDRARGTPEQQARLAALDAKDTELTHTRDKTRDRGEKERIRAAQCLGATGQQVFRHVIMPATVPYIITGVRLAMGNSFMTVVAAEMIAAQSGVGFLIFSSRLFAQTDYVFTGIISLGIMGSVADLLLRKIVGLVAYRYDIKL
jgi:hypothetical protein